MAGEPLTQEGRAARRAFYDRLDFVHGLPMASDEDLDRLEASWQTQWNAAAEAVAAPLTTELDAARREAEAAGVEAAELRRALDRVMTDILPVLDYAQSYITEQGKNGFGHFDNRPFEAQMERAWECARNLCPPGLAPSRAATIAEARRKVCEDPSLLRAALGVLADSRLVDLFNEGFADDLVQAEDLRKRAGAALPAVDALAAAEREEVRP